LLRCDHLGLHYRPPLVSGDASGKAQAPAVMLTRVGTVLYWAGCLLAAVALLSGVFALQHGPEYDHRWVVYVASVGSAVLFWLIGRACKYFLADE